MNSKQTYHSSLLTPNYVIGIIGGMGPEATVTLFSKIVEKSKAFVKVDQDHVRIVIDNNPKIPDRTQFIIGKGSDPLPEIINTAKNLEKAGVTIGAIPCMTSHYFIKEIQNAVTYPIINAYIETQNYIAQKFPEVKKIGVLSTTGTRKTKLFEKYITDHEVIFPSWESQENKVMEAIYGEMGIKKGELSKNNSDLLIEASKELISDGAQLIIAGCTEIPLVLKDGMLNVPIVDPMDIVAEKLIESNK